jgi:hypothetical protein
MTPAIRCRNEADFEVILSIINDSARACTNKPIREDCCEDSYMSLDELRGEIANGPVFRDYEEISQLAGVMASNAFRMKRRSGTRIYGLQINTVGWEREPLLHLRKLSSGRLMVGTWADALSAIHFCSESIGRVLNARLKHP